MSTMYTAALTNKTMSSYYEVYGSAGGNYFYSTYIPGQPRTYGGPTSLILTAKVSQTEYGMSMSGTWTLTGNLYIEDLYYNVISTTAISDSGSFSQKFTGSSIVTTITSAAGGIESTTSGSVDIWSDDGKLWLDIYPGSGITFAGPGSVNGYASTIGPASASSADSGSGQSQTGGAGNDTLSGGAGNDTLSGGAGNDTLSGGAGNDSMLGGAGNDILDGGEGNDYMAGGSGNDTYYVDAAKDTVYEADNTPEGSSGIVLQVNLSSTIDTVISAVKYTLGNYVENLTLSGSTAKLTGTGNELDNVITGSALANTLTGKDGADTINGGAGADKLSGGAGADVFVFTNLDAADTISDFADEDVLKFDTSVFTSLNGISASNLCTDTKLEDTNDYLIYTKGALYYDTDGSGSTAAIKIVAIKGTDAKTINFDDFAFA